MPLEMRVTSARLKVTQSDVDQDGLGDECDDFNCVASEVELCNGIDDDCDMLVDEDVLGLGDGCYAEVVATVPWGHQGIDAGDLPADAYPTREVCDGQDND